MFFTLFLDDLEGLDTMCPPHLSYIQKPCTSGFNNYKIVMSQVWREIGPVTMAKPGKSPTKSRASSSDDEKSQRRSMSPQASSGSTGPPMIKYRIRYEHGSKNLLVAVLEARVITLFKRRSSKVLEKHS